MPLAEWYLTTWHQRQRFPQTGAIKVEIDPSRIGGQRGTFGPALFFPYTLPDTKESSPLELFALEGWIGWGQEADASARLRIPTQTLWPGQPALQVPLTDVQLEAIEEARKGGAVQFTITLAGQATMTARLSQPVNTQPPHNAAASAVEQVVLGLAPVQCTSNTSLVIEREHWLRILQQLGAGTRRLVELPEPRLPRQDPRWGECLRLLEAAIQHYRSGAYEEAMKNCRQVVEGIPQVLADAWGLPKPQNGQPSFEKWLLAIEGRLTAAWQQDKLTPGMLYTLLSGAWKWSAPAPHYGTDIPLREEVAFALGLCTDLLLFAGLALQGHPNPIFGGS